MEEENTAVFVPLMGELVYDPDEIEHPMYMFDHRYVGCVVLRCTRSMDTKQIGQAFLDHQELPQPFFYTYETPDIPPVTLLGIYVRGFVEYERKYTLFLRNFRCADGTPVPEQSFQLTGAKGKQEEKGYEEHDAVALQGAREGMILLKNDDRMLPLPQGSVLNLFGSGVSNYRTSVTGAGRINPRSCPDLRTAIKTFTRFQLNPELDRFYRVPTDEIPPEDLLQRAQRQQDAAVVIFTRGSGENIDNQPIEGEYYLTGKEERLLGEVCRIFRKVAVVLNTGYPIGMKWLRKYPVSAVIYAGIAGQGGARALAEILEGAVNPSGRLTDTWAWDYFDHPSSANFYCPPDRIPVKADDPIWAQTFYEEGIYVGYRYFETFQKPVAFPFGHGLSYTEFIHSPGVMSEERNGLKFSFLIRNTGSCPGKESILLYASLPGTLQEQPVRQLAAFGKTRELKPGESQELTFFVPFRRLSTWVEKENAWMLEKGRFFFFAGGSVREAEYAHSWENQEVRLEKKLEFRLPLPCDWQEMSQAGKYWPDGIHTGLRPEAEGLPHKRNCRLPETVLETAKKNPEGETRITYRELCKNPELLERFTAQMTDEELCRLIVMYGSGWGMENKGEAGRLAPSEAYGFPEYACADGNCGVNIRTPNIGMPSSVVLCATFHTELVLQVGRVIGEEAAEHHIRMILAPGMNLHRNPLNGRHPEYFSEDPYLTGVMAAAQLKGLHQAGIADSVKHVACNNCETSRKRNHSLVGERALRELYLRAFAFLMEEEMPDTIMTGYNALNGSMCGENEILLEGIFRKELGFDGFAMTDWNSYDTTDMAEAVRAGISWLTPGENDNSRVMRLLHAVRKGMLNRAVLERNVQRMLKVMVRRENI